MNSSFSVIAHRGESFDAPENTISSVKLAWERNADSVEIDVHLTRDNSVIVFHDYDTRRFGGVRKRIRDSNYSDLLKLDVGNFKDSKFKGEQIPLLQEILSTVPAGKKLLVEIKSNAAIIPYLVAEIENSKLNPNQLFIMSFAFNIIKAVKTKLPEITCLWLYSPVFFRRRILSFRVNSIINKIKSANLEGINVEKGKWINKKVVDRIKNAGLKIFVWTVNDIQEAERYMKLGVNGIASDRASWIKKEILRLREKESI